MLHCLPYLLPQGCQYSAALPSADGRTLIAAGSDRRIKELEGGAGVSDEGVGQGRGLGEWRGFWPGVWFG